MLDHVSWHFDGTKFDVQEDFNEAITEWNHGLAEDCSEDGLIFEWNPSEIIIDQPKIRVEYSYSLEKSYILFPEERITPYFKRKLLAAPNGQKVYIRLMAELTADNGRNFSTLEVMYKLHKLHANKIREYYFEGFYAVGIDKDGVPVYRLSVGT